MTVIRNGWHDVYPDEPPGVYARRRLLVQARTATSCCTGPGPSARPRSKPRSHIEQSEPVLSTGHDAAEKACECKAEILAEIASIGPRHHHRVTSGIVKLT